MRRSGCLPFLSLLLISLAASAQCPAPEKIAPSTEANIFTAEQEQQLGELVAQGMSRTLRTIEEPAVTGRLYEIGRRLLGFFPESNLRLQFFVIDSPDINAFAIGGGRIYVTRKLITAARSEDELAGVLAHEMGHQIAHHTAITMSRVFRRLLDVKSIKDRADLEERYHQAIDEWWRKADRLPESDVDREQGQADRVALYALARAGYSPQALVDWFDRITENKGRKGSWVGDLLGTTRPEAKRLREFVKEASALAAPCASAAPALASDPSAFLAWQKLVRSYSGFGKTEAVHGLIARRKLEPWLQGEIEHLRFSPDGRLILAQDDASVFVLSREPLQPLFRIDAPDAYPAQFSPDSNMVVFYTSNLRVERWSIPEQRREDVFEVYRYRGCAQSALSPSGDLLACVRRVERHSYCELLLLDVATGEPKYTMKDIADVAMWTGAVDVRMSFSRDGKYLLAVGSSAPFAYDLAAGREIPVPPAMHRLLLKSFAWIGSEFIVGVGGDKGDESEMLTFPAGKSVANRLALGLHQLRSVAHGKYVLVSPLVTAPVGIADLNQNKITIGNKTPALDVYDGVFVSERKSGEIALYAEPGKPLAITALPRAPLGPTVEAEVSPDLGLLAVSGRSRAAVWQTSSGERLFHIIPFDNATPDGAGFLASLIAPDARSAHRMMGQKAKEYLIQEREKPGHTVARLNVSSRRVEPLSSYKRLFQVRLNGPYTIVTTPATPDGSFFRDVNIEARDTASGTVLWSRHFEKERPSIFGSDHGQYTVFVWDADDRALDTELKDDVPNLKRLGALKYRYAVYFLEIVDSKSGKIVSKFLAETGQSPWIRRFAAHVSGNAVLTTDLSNRLTIYSLTGERKGRLFGQASSVSSTGQLAIEGEPGRLTLYDMTTLARRDQFTFAADVTYTAFSADGKRLLVLTQDQTVYILDVGRNAAAAGR